MAVDATGIVKNNTSELLASTVHTPTVKSNNEKQDDKSTSPRDGDEQHDTLFAADITDDTLLSSERMASEEFCTSALCNREGTNPFEEPRSSVAIAQDITGVSPVYSPSLSDAASSFHQEDANHSMVLDDIHSEDLLPMATQTSLNGSAVPHPTEASGALGTVRVVSEAAQDPDPQSHRESPDMSAPSSLQTLTLNEEETQQQLSNVSSLKSLSSLQSSGENVLGSKSVDLTRDTRHNSEACPENFSKTMSFESNERQEEAQALSVFPFPDNHETAVLLRKKEVYEHLLHWEEERLERTLEVDRILDPLANDLFTIVQTSKESNSQLIRYLKDRAKLNHDIIAKLRTVRGARSASGQTTIPQGSTASEAELGVPAVEEEEISAVAKDEPCPVSPLTVTSGGWVAALQRCTFYEAGFLESFTEMIEAATVSGSFVRASRDYEKATTILLQRLHEARSRLRAQLREVQKSWADLQKLFKETNDKGDKKRHDRHSRGSPTQRTLEDVASSSGYESPSPTATTGVGTVGGKEAKDCWLFERRYFHAVVTGHQMQVAYFHVLRQTLMDLQHLENWRSVMMRNTILQYLLKMRESLGQTASCIGSVHSLIDPDSFIKAKVEFLNQNPAASSEQQSSVEPLRETLNRPQQDEPLSMPPRFILDASQKSSEESKDESAEALKLDEHVLRPQLEALLAQVRRLIGDNVPPEPRLVIKMAHVRRLAGMFGKWSEGLLVLTWDRCLHMFRSHDDLQPLWSLSVPSLDIRVTEEKPGLKTVELREKRGLLTMLGQRTFSFRPVSDVEHASWLRCLALATSADDKAYRLEGITNARSADAAAFHDYYSTWVHQQRGLDGSNGILSINQEAHSTETP